MVAGDRKNRRAQATGNHDLGALNDRRRRLFHRGIPDASRLKQVMRLPQEGEILRDSEFCFLFSHSEERKMPHCFPECRAASQGYLDYFARLVAWTSGSATTCSERNHTCNSFVRNTSLTKRSFVPSSPISVACLAMLRDSRRMTSCP
jgi:hypothetical protein